jgi:glc operon protein GlcG
MTKPEIAVLAQKIIAEVEKIYPGYEKSPQDWNINNGNVAVCLVEKDGTFYGKMFGTENPKMRDTCRAAWTKATQVWLTGYPTGKYEELVYSGQVEWWKFGIMKPDFIGWEGGIPLELNGEIVLSAGFSGFMGDTDVAVLKEAFQKALG